MPFNNLKVRETSVENMMMTLMLLRTYQQMGTIIQNSTTQHTYAKSWIFTDGSRKL